MSDDNGKILTDVVGRVLKITIDRSDKMNAFTPEMMEGLSAALTRLDEDSELWVGVIVYAGKHATAGLDLPKFAGSMREGSSKYTDEGVDPFTMKRRCRKPVITAVQGICFTVGIEMMLGSDIVVAADDCRFCQMEPKRGIGVFGGAHARYVERAGWGNAMYHLLRADEFGSERALQLGMVQEVVPAGQQQDRAMELAQEIAENAPLAVQWIKRASTAWLLEGEQASFDMIPQMKKETANSADAKEGVQSFIERRKAVFTGK